MLQEQLFVHDDTSLEELLTRKPVSGIGPQTKIVLSLYGMTPAETEYWQRQLNTLYFECGCSMGATVMFIALGLYLVFLVMRPVALFANIWIDVGIGFIIFFSGAGIGKYWGLNIAKQRLKKTVAQLKVHIVEQTS